MGTRGGGTFPIRRNLGRTVGFQEGMCMCVLKLSHKSTQRRNALFKQVHSTSEVGDVGLVSLRGEHPSGCRVRRCLAIACIPHAFRTAFFSSHASRIPAQMFMFLCSPNHFRPHVLVFELGPPAERDVMVTLNQLLGTGAALEVAQSVSRETFPTFSLRGIKPIITSDPLRFYYLSDLD